MSQYKPEFKGPIEGWIVNHMERHYWRVQASMTRMDVMQEAHVIFLRCSTKYASVVTNPKHFMALFKVAWVNHFTDLAYTDSKNRCEVVPPADMQMDSIGDLENEGYMRTLIRQAPKEVALVLALFLNAPAELLQLATSPLKSGRNGARAADNRRVAALLGLPADSEPLDAVERYLAD